MKREQFGEIASAQLHHFADASEDGYGTVSYLLLDNNHGHAHCAFIMGKARVAPLKPVTLARMELTAAVVAGRMDKMWRKELRMQLQDSVFWTDSTSVLKFINNKTSRFRTFVANRVSEMFINVSDTSQWRYGVTTNNPADIPSRGMREELFLKNTTCISGPAFLLNPEKDCPVNPDNVKELRSLDPEVKRTVDVYAIEVKKKTMH